MLYIIQIQYTLNYNFYRIIFKLILYYNQMGKNNLNSCL